MRRSDTPLRLARLSTAPFTDRLVSKFSLPVVGWRERAASVAATAGTAAERAAAAPGGGRDGQAPRRRGHHGRGGVSVLEEIAIENLGVIRSARVPVGAGLTVITGETGAGKTMVLTGLGLLMGGKADPATVRPGAASAVVEGRVRVADRPAVAQRVDDAGGQVDDDGSVVILRTVAAEGRSRAHLGGRSVPQGVLAEIADDLVTVHGQSDQLRLRTASRQRVALDAFAGPQHADLPGSTARRGPSGRRCRRRSTTSRRARASVPGRRSCCASGSPRSSGSRPSRARTSSSPRSSRGSGTSRSSGSPRSSRTTPSRATRPPSRRRTPSCRSTARAARSKSVAGTDPALARLAERLAEVGYVLADVATEISGYVEDLAADPAGLESAHARLAELGTLTRSYGETVDDVLAWASDAGLRLLDLDDGGERLQAATARRDELDAELDRLGTAITASRERAAAELATAVTESCAGSPWEARASSSTSSAPRSPARGASTP